MPFSRLAVLLCIFVVTVSAVAFGIPAVAATHLDANGNPIVLGPCTAVSTRIEADATHVFTRKPKPLQQLWALYRQYRGSDPTCAELQLVTNNKMSAGRLRTRLIANATKEFRALGTSRYEGQTVSTARHEWYLVRQGTLHHIPHWPTSLSWGLLIDDRRTIPEALTTTFYANATVSTPLQYRDGPFHAVIEDVWKREATDYTARLPQLLADEVARLRENPSFDNIFEATQYVNRVPEDPRATLLDWSWLAGNPANFLVAFYGDQGYGANARAVLQLIKNEGADLAVHLGDFDYLDQPDLWAQQMDDVLGADFPVFAVAGNHDLAAWDSYQTKIAERAARIPGATCTGELGVNTACSYHGLLFVLSGVGTVGSGHVSYLKDQLAASTARWKICAWHKNQRLMQVGGKGDEVGWEAYDTCRDYGAIIATAHEHSYERTTVLRNFQTQDIVDVDETILTVKPGQTFAFVAGLGGHSIRDQEDELAANPWWGSVYTKTQGALYGALFCSFNHDADPRAASCSFKNIRGDVADRFTVRTEIGM